MFSCTFSLICSFKPMSLFTFCYSGLPSSTAVLLCTMIEVLLKLRLHWSVLKANLVCWCVAPGGLGRQQPWVPAAAGEGAPAAVPPIPVPEAERQLTPALWVRQPARGPRLRPQHGNLRRTQEQLGNGFNTKESVCGVGAQQWLKSLCASDQDIVSSNTSADGGKTGRIKRIYPYGIKNCINKM